MAIEGQVVDVGSVGGSYTADPQVVIPFEPDRIVIINEDAAGSAYVSFDGATDHIHLTGGAAPVVLKQKATRIWLRDDTGAGDVQIIAEA